MAYDENGRKFEKSVEIIEERESDRKILDFGWPVQYYVEAMLKHYPFKKPLCIDMMGRNHKGSSVYVSAEDMNKVFETLIIKSIKGKCPICNGSGWVRSPDYLTGAEDGDPCPNCDGTGLFTSLSKKDKDDIQT